MGAVIGVIARWLPADIPVELFVGWAAWLLGGLLLMLWFTRQSRANRVPPFRPVSPSEITVKRSGTHAVARQSSGSHAVARPSTRQPAAGIAPVTYSAPKPGGPIPDAYSELSLLLDSVDDHSRSNP
jgi:hypothetical protein